MRQFVILLVVTLILIVIYSVHLREPFEDTPCNDYDNCVSCANKAKCTWCSTSKKCLSKSEINGTDALCNQINLVHTASMCEVDPSIDYAPSYNGRTTKKSPPMVYMNKDMSYSPETVMANVEQLRKEVDLIKQIK